MYKKNTNIIVDNRGKKEIGLVERTWVRKGIRYYNIKTEAGGYFEGITLDTSFPVHINESLSNVLSKK